MRDMLLSAMPVLLWAMAALNLLLLLLLLRQYRKAPKDVLPLLMAFETFGLVYDALILALGTVVPAGETLRILSLLRFVLHAGLVPLLLPICGEALHVKGLLRKVIWALTLLLAVAGVAASFSTVLSVQQIGGVVRYASDKAATPRWAETVQSALSYGPVIVLIVCGAIAWVREKNAHLFLAGFLMFAFAALGPATRNFDLIFFISMFGEVLMTLFFWLFARRRAERNA